MTPASPSAQNSAPPGVAVLARQERCYHQGHEDEEVDDQHDDYRRLEALREQIGRRALEAGEHRLGSANDQLLVELVEQFAGVGDR